MPLSIKNRTLMLVGTAKTLGPLHPLYYPRKKGKGVKVPLMGHQNTPNLGGLGENHKLSPKGTLVLCPMRTMDQLGPFESCIFLFIVYLLDRGKPSDPYKLRVAKPTLHIYIAYPGTTHTRAASASGQTTQCVRIELRSRKPPPFKGMKSSDIFIPFRTGMHKRSHTREQIPYRVTAHMLASTHNAIYLLDRGKHSDPYTLKVAKPTLHIYSISRHHSYPSGNCHQDKPHSVFELN